MTKAANTEQVATFEDIARLPRPAKYALIACGRNRIEYTSGVLQALGYTDLSNALERTWNQLEAARVQKEQARQPSPDPWFRDDSVPLDLKQHVTDCNADFEVVFRRIDEIRRYASDSISMETGGSVA